MVEELRRQPTLPTLLRMGRKNAEQMGENSHLLNNPSNLYSFSLYLQGFMKSCEGLQTFLGEQKRSEQSFSNEECFNLLIFYSLGRSPNSPWRSKTIQTEFLKLMMKMTVFIYSQKDDQLFFLFL